MRNKALLPLALLIATTGCAYIRDAVCPKPEAPLAAGQRQPVEERAAHFCPEKECIVTVTVKDKCVVSVDRYYLVMAGRGEMTIVWQIAGKGTFARNPIRWKQRAAESVFVPSGKPSETRVAFTNNRTIGVFNYGITVNQGKETCPELDPTGINDMP